MWVLCSKYSHNSILTFIHILLWIRTVRTHVYCCMNCMCLCSPEKIGTAYKVPLRGHHISCSEEPETCQTISPSPRWALVLSGMSHGNRQFKAGVRLWMSAGCLSCLRLRKHESLFTFSTSRSFQFALKVRSWRRWCWPASVPGRAFESTSCLRCVTLWQV